MKIIKRDNEQLNFKIDDSILNHLIHSQSTSLVDAVVELIQNSIDSGSGQINIKFDRHSIELCDNGSGLGTKEEFIENLGTWALGKERGISNKFGRFGIGRGQIMRYGIVTWASSNYKLTTNILKSGFSYTIEEMDEFISGCKLTCVFYSMEDFNFEKEEDRDWYYSLAINKYIIKGRNGYLLKGEIKFKVRYVNDTIVNFNEEQINTGFEENEMIYENDNFYLFKPEERERLVIYNLGVRVNSFNPVESVNGILVSKKHLKLNTSRDNVLRSEYWLEIVNDLNEFFKISIGFKKYNNPNQSVSILTLLLNNEISIKALWESKMFLLNKTSKRISLDEVVNSNKPYVLANYKDEKDTLLIDRIIQTKGVNVLDKDQFPEDFLEEYYSIDGEYSLELMKKNRSVYDYSHLVNDETLEIHDNELSFTELAVLNSLRNSYNEIPSEFQPEGRRKIMFAVLKSGVYANTDGHTSIYFDRLWTMKEISKKNGLNKVLNVLIHEASHSLMEESLIHNDCFYKRFHDISLGCSYVKLTKRFKETYLDAHNKARIPLTKGIPALNEGDEWGIMQAKKDSKHYEECHSNLRYILESFINDFYNETGVEEKDRKMFILNKGKGVFMHSSIEHDYYNEDYIDLVLSKRYSDLFHKYYWNYFNNYRSSFGIINIRQGFGMKYWSDHFLSVQTNVETHIVTLRTKTNAYGIETLELRRRNHVDIDQSLKIRKYSSTEEYEFINELYKFWENLVNKKGLEVDNEFITNNESVHLLIKTMYYRDKTILESKERLAQYLKNISGEN